MQPGADDLARLNLRRVCDEFGGEYGLASGEERSLDRYRVLATEAYREGSLSAIAIRKLGRFGNNLRQILHATFFAEAAGVRRIHLDEVNVALLRAPETIGGITFVPQRAREGRDAVLAGWFFHSAAFRTLFAALDAPRRWRIVSSYLRPLLSLRWGDVEPAEGDVLHIHVRAGDVFGERVHHSYAQPPLAYYKAVVKHFTRRRRSPRIVVVYEDRGNPCVDALCALLARDRLDFALHHADFDDTILELLSARSLAVGVGTFAPMVGLVAPHLERIYAFRRVTEDATFRARGTEVILARDVGRGYIGEHEWRNSDEQRARMLAYPDDHVQILP